MIFDAYDLMMDQRKDIIPLRTFIVQSFIKLTSHFTKGAFTNLLLEQENTSKSQMGIYDENKDIELSIANLAKNVEDVISFDKIDPSLVFFHEGEGPLFSIITNKSKNDNEYKAFLNLIITQTYGKSPQLPNYPKYKQKDFLTELKNILNIHTPVTKEEAKGSISLEEISGDYVFTPDNFVKMVLILIRLRSGIPVIMMGETGCGKTSLIRKLSEIKNNGNKKK